MLPTEIEYEDLRAKYREEDARGIPMSVRERYERALANLRVQLRREPHARPLGETLVELGALDRAGLQQGLADQHLRANGELLGEILLSLNLVKEEALLEALRRQASAN
jgi:hypothetical protein